VSSSKGPSRLSERTAINYGKYLGRAAKGELRRSTNTLKNQRGITHCSIQETKLRKVEMKGSERLEKEINSSTSDPRIIYIVYCCTSEEMNRMEKRRYFTGLYLLITKCKQRVKGSTAKATFYFT